MDVPLAGCRGGAREAGAPLLTPLSVLSGARSAPLLAAGACETTAGRLVAAIATDGTGTEA